MHEIMNAVRSITLNTHVFCKACLPEQTAGGGTGACYAAKECSRFLASPRAGIIQDVRFVGILCSLEAQTAVVKWLVPYVEIDPSINDLPPRRIVPFSSV